MNAPPGNVAADLWSAAAGQIARLKCATVLALRGISARLKSKRGMIKSKILKRCGVRITAYTEFAGAGLIGIKSAK
jgi:hypothetical protein